MNSKVLIYFCAAMFALHSGCSSHFTPSIHLSRRLEREIEEDAKIRMHLPIDKKVELSARSAIELRPGVTRIRATNRSAWNEYDASKPYFNATYLIVDQKRWYPLDRSDVRFLEALNQLVRAWSAWVRVWSQELAEEELEGLHEDLIYGARHYLKDTTPPSVGTTFGLLLCELSECVTNSGYGSPSSSESLLLSDFEMLKSFALSPEQRSAMATVARDPHLKLDRKTKTWQLIGTTWQDDGSAYEWNLSGEGMKISRVEATPLFPPGFFPNRGMRVGH